MLRNISFFTFFISLFSFAQNQISPGLYLVNEKNSKEKFSLQINPDQSFYVVVLDGNIKYQDGKYRLVLDQVAPTSVGVELNDNVPVNTSKLKVEIDTYLLYYAYQIYYSFDDQNDFKNLNELFESEMNSKDETVQIEINRPKAIYILEKNGEGQNQVARYDIPASAGGIKLFYQNTGFETFDDFQLFQDPSDNTKLKLDVGVQKFEMIKKEFKVADTHEIKPEMSINTTFEFPADETYGDDTVEVVTAPEEVTPYEFKSFNSLTEAQKEIAGTDRFLVVGYDTSADFPNNFNEMIKTIGNNLYYYQPEEPETAPKFEFYPLKDSEKSLFTKNDIKDFPHIAIINTDGIILYHVKNDFENSYYNFIGYNSTFDYLNNAQAKYKFDKLMKNKKVSLKDFQDVLTFATQNVSVPYDLEASNEPVDYSYPVKIEAVEAVEAAATTVEAVDDEELKNYYQLQTKKDVFEQKWTELVKSHQNDTTPDVTYIDLLKRTLINMGGLAFFYNTKISKLTEADQLGIEYLLKFENEVNAINNEAMYEYDETNINLSSKQVIANYFKELNNYNRSESEQNAFNQYFKTILDKTNYDYSLTHSYLNNLMQEDITKDNLAIYAKFFNKNFNQNTSIIEQLDNYFSNTVTSEYEFSDWNAFKYDFSNLANNMAWYVVTDSKEANKIKEAINWSEASLMVTKNNGYYLDTLAQLYYLDGQKTKAIETQKKAIANTSEMEDPGTLDEMKSVLNKMEKGVY